MSLVSDGKSLILIYKAQYFHARTFSLSEEKLDVSPTPLNISQPFLLQENEPRSHIIYSTQHIHELATSNTDFRIILPPVL